MKWLVEEVRVVGPPCYQAHKPHNSHSAPKQYAPNRQLTSALALMCTMSLGSGECSMKRVHSGSTAGGPVTNRCRAANRYWHVCIFLHGSILRAQNALSVKPTNGFLSQNRKYRKMSGSWDMPGKGGWEQLRNILRDRRNMTCSRRNVSIVIVWKVKCPMCDAGSERLMWRW